MLYYINYSSWLSNKWRKFCFTKGAMISYILKNRDDYGYIDQQMKYRNAKKGDYIYFNYNISSGRYKLT